jgi:hypothetical protein
MIKEIHTRLGIKKIKMVEWNSGEIPETVYKYRDWKNDFHRKILLHQELFIPSPRLFNDPFDCRITLAYHLLKNNEKLALEYFEQVVSRHYPMYTKAQRDIEVLKLIKEGRFRNDDFVKKENQKSIEKLHDMLGVYSVTAVNDNVLMWAHYSNNHEGFCIGFNSVKLFNHFGGGQEIQYKEEYPTILPTENFEMQWINRTYIKALYWDYEIEYRLTKSNFANKIITLPKEIIKEVILGYKIPESDERDILKIISIELPHIKKYKAIPKERSFELELKEIE